MVLKSYLQAARVLTHTRSAPPLGCACLFSRGAGASWVLNRCIEVLKRELMILKGIAKISYTY